MSCFVHRMENKERRKKAWAQQEQAEQGVFACSRCGHELFEAGKKFDSGTGFPSFWLPIGENVKEKFLDTYGRERIQLLCNNCDQHLGHLFNNKATPSRLRYCINNNAIAFKKPNSCSKSE